MPTFGENLKALRKSRGYSQDRFARVIGSNQIVISSWERGDRVPSVSTMQHVADAFHVPLSSLIPFDDSNQEDQSVQEIADMLRKNPNAQALFDRMKYLDQSDFDAIIAVIDCITRRDFAKFSENEE